MLRCKSLYPFALAGVVCLAGCPADEVEPPVICSGDQVLDPVSNTCQAAAETCAVERPGSIAARCLAEQRECYEDAAGAVCGVCRAGWRELDGACAPLLDCDALDCTALGRACEPASARTNARCGACLEERSELEGDCVALHCEAEGPGSLLEACAREHRHCVAGDGDVAHCGGCWPGRLDDGGLCRTIRSCAAQRCEVAHRLCAPPSDERDADCLECLGGYVDVGGLCIRDELAVCASSTVAHAITDQCAAEGRACEPDASGARCGPCLADLFEDPTSKRCVPARFCADLDCARDHRVCEGEPLARCAGCAAGYTEDPAMRGCREIVTCADITCAEGDECVFAGDNADAFCRKDCGGNAIWGGARCEPCPRCDDVGEVGRYPHPTAAGNCICETRPGYFYSVGADVGSFRCDADDDGWIRESARTALESADSVLRDNARCELRVIHSFRLINEAGETLTASIADPLEMYETDRNDDDVLLQSAWARRGLPAHGARALRATELNRLTKLCHHPLADYNDNGIADVEEWADSPTPPSFRAEHRPFNAFSYFIELYDGAYEVGPDGGRYVIRERGRAPSAELKVPVGFPATDGEHWKTCALGRDIRHGVERPIGMDLSRFTARPGFGGMNLHSLFKCLVFDAEPEGSNLNELTPADAAAFGYRVNRCGTEGDPIGDAGNPRRPPLECAPIEAAELRPGDVGWGAVPYLENGPRGLGVYQRGCVNDCVAELPSCPSYNLNPDAVTCAHDADDFGRFVACDVVEVCDGLDNDGLNGVDDGNPGGGLDCDTGQHGVCAAGSTNCRAGQIHCDRLQDPSAELCNGLDDSCDGEVDEANPESGAACIVSGQVGICADGLTECVGGEVQCLQTQQPEPLEICGNGLDDNCSGEADEGDNGPGCIDYYIDVDGDGFGAENTLPRCLCGPDAANDFTALVGGDCCDIDPMAKPQANIQSQENPNQCGRYDYDCDGQETLQSTRVATEGCGQCSAGACPPGLLLCCCDPSHGWANALPSCSTQSATFYTGSCSWWPVCAQDSIQLRVKCK